MSHTLQPLPTPERPSEAAPVAAALFRSEVVAYQAAHRQWGSIIELRPVRARSLTWAALAVAARQSSQRRRH